MEFCGDCCNIFLKSIEKSVLFSDVYRFFDTSIAIKSDRKDMLGWFRRLYPRFRMENSEEKADSAYYMIVGDPEGPFVIVEEDSCLRIKSFDDKSSVIFYANALTFNHISANLQKHFLLHGAAVSWAGKGVAIAGPSCYGKTSLTLQLLLRKGFSFLSDDQLAINRASRLIDPFPRSLGIRENTLALFDELEIRHLESYVGREGQRKWLVDISEISENGIGDSCRLKYLVFLVNSGSEEGKEEKQIELTLDEVNDGLLEKFRSIARNREINCRSMGGFYFLTFQPEAETPSALEVDQLCKEYGVWLLSVRESSNAKPDFSRSPQIEAISWHEAVMELLRGLQNDFRNTPVQVFLELAEVLKNVDCCKLSIGKLDEMGEHIWNLVSNPEQGSNPDQLSTHIDQNN